MKAVAIIIENIFHLQLEETVIKVKDIYNEVE